MKNKALIIKDIYHKYDNDNSSSWVLDSVNLDIEDGKLLGLLGPSGCGKTTLLRLIAGFAKPNRGKIFLHDNEISSRSNVLAPEKRNIGMVFQDYALFPHLNVIENAKFGLKNKRDTSRVNYLLKVLGIDLFWNKYPHELSGGQKQRLAIARALAPGTSFLLLDEPFCSLDSSVRLRIRSELPNLLKSCKASGLMVTHDPEEAMAICDKVAIMNNGRIHQCDDPQTLMNNPKTIFVSRFIQGNNILKIKFENNIACTTIGNVKTNNYKQNSKFDYLSISPNSLEIIKSNKGNGVIVSKEYLGEFFIYRILIQGEEIRVKEDLLVNYNVGEKCDIGFKQDCSYYLFPGGFKNKILI